MHAAVGHCIDPPLPSFAGQIEPARAPASFSVGLLVIALAMGAVVEFFGPTGVQRTFEATKVTGVVGLSALLGALFTAMALHEGGHLVAALLMRFAILGVGLGPIRASRSHGNWKLQSSGKLFCASVSAVPRENVCWRERMLVVVAGGPAATLLTGLAAFVLLPRYWSEEWTRTFLGALFQLSCFLFLLGLVPNGRTAPVRNDARLFLTLWNDTPEAREIFLYHLITQLKIGGVRPRDYPEELIRTVAGIDWGRPDSMRFYAQTVEQWARERNDLATAEAWLARAGELSKEQPAKRTARAAIRCTSRAA